MLAPFTQLDRRRNLPTSVEISQASRLQHIKAHGSLLACPTQIDGQNEKPAAQPSTTSVNARKPSVGFLVACVANLALGPRACAFGLLPSGNEITAVSSRVFNGYRRTTLADGTFRTEKYGFAIGGHLTNHPAGLQGPPPTPTSDPTIDGISFSEIARMIEGPLATQKYVPTSEPKTADLLIVVFWGRTIGTSAFSQSGMDQVRLGSDQDRIALENAKLLGFDSERVFQAGFGDSANMMANIRKQLYSSTVTAIQEDRYFVILEAFDFQPAW